MLTPTRPRTYATEPDAPPPVPSTQPVPDLHRHVQTGLAGRSWVRWAGVAAYLLGIREPDQLRTHPLRGALFESWIASEIMKRSAHQGLRQALFHYRDAAGLEVDLIVSDAQRVMLLEAKSGATIASDFTHAVDRLARVVRERELQRIISTHVVYGGTTRQSRGETNLTPWNEIDQLTMTEASHTP